mgnify:CR=1 FL=1
MKTKDFLKKYDACSKGAKWALSIGEEMDDVWNAMVEQGKYDWLLWTSTRQGVFQDSSLRKLVCRFIRQTPLSNGRTVWDLLEDERSRKAVEVAELYADGKATSEELKNVSEAARGAYNDTAADDGASFAAAAAVRASASDHSYAATDAARDTAYATIFAAAYDTDDAAVKAAAKVAQAQMIAEMGNPFKEERTEK